MAKQIGLRQEIIDLLGQKPHTHRELCDALVMPGDAIKPVTDALYKLQREFMAAKGADGYIHLVKADGQDQPMSHYVAKIAEAIGAADTSDLVSAVKSIVERNKASEDVLKAVQLVIGAENDSLVDLPGRVREELVNREAWMGLVHRVCSRLDIPPGHIEQRLIALQNLAEDRLSCQSSDTPTLDPRPPALGFIVTGACLLHDSEEEAIDFAQEQAQSGQQVMIAAVTRIGDVPPVRILWQREAV